MKVFVRGCAIVAPGLPDWETAARVLSGQAPYRRESVRDLTPLALPANERRRTPETARWALAAGLDALAAAGLAPADVATVFASCGSDGPITNQICEALARPVRALSPTQFHNSVHNAPSGYWSIALATRAPSTSVCAGEATFAAALLEACTQATVEHRHVLLIAYDVPYPRPLAGLWTVDEPLAVALALSHQAPGPRLQLRVEAARERAQWPAELPECFRSNPASASAPLLALLARGNAGVAHVDAMPGQSLRVAVTP